MGPRRWLLLWTMTVAAATLAATADLQLPEPGHIVLALDLVTGLASVAGASAAVGAAPGTRLLMALVGMSWLVGSFVPLARTSHQGFLLVVIATYPRLRLRSPVDRALVGLGLLLVLPLVSPPMPACCFALIAVGRAGRWGGRGGRGRSAYPILAASAVAAALGGAWAYSRLQPLRFDPAVSLVSYEVVLILVALGFPLAWRRSRAQQQLIADELLAAGVEEIDGFSSVLRRFLGDPTLRVDPWHADRGSFVCAEEDTDADEAWRQTLIVTDGDAPVARVVSAAAALEDPATAAAVATAVRLAVTHVRLREELQARLRELESARLRLVAAGDRQREQAAADVRAAVDAPLRLAGHEVDLARHALVGPGADALAVVSAELGAASRELQELVQGTPAVRLGNGGLGAALETLVAVRGGVVELRVEEGAVADRLLETTLFYVCSEALANATKHANATRVSLLVRRVGQRLEVVVRDDGTGGADPTGSGLQGLVDRLETVRGQLQVTSPPGAGTEVRATVPLS